METKMQIKRLNTENIALKKEVKLLKEELNKTPLPNKESFSIKEKSSTKHIHKREMSLPKGFSIEEPTPLFLETKAFASPDAKLNTEPHTNPDNTIKIIRTLSPGMLVYIDEVKDKIEYWIDKLKELTVETASLAKLKYVEKDNLKEPNSFTKSFDWTKKNVFSPTVRRNKLQSPKVVEEKKSLKGDNKRKKNSAEGKCKQ